MAMVVNLPRDPNTLSNYNNFITVHVETNLDINFDRKTISGNVSLRLKSITDSLSKEILLDTSFLNVRNVALNGRKAKWELLPRFEPYGSALKIRLDEGVANEETCIVDVRR